MTPNPAEQVMQVALGYMASSALYVAAHLNIADHLAHGPRSSSELAAATGMNADALHRILRLLASLGLFEQVAPKTYGLTPAGELLRKGVPGSLHGMAHFLPNPLHYKIYAHIMEAVETGTPAADAALGMPLFEYFSKNPEESEIFNDAMTAFSAPVAAAAIDVYDFSRFETIVDVAGGHGEVLMSILRAAPESRGVLAEVGHVVQGAIPRIAKAGLDGRLSAVECDFFKSVPTGGDLYVMKHIIHDWDDERAALILNNINAAMGAKNGTVVLLEAIVPEGPEPSLGKFIDIEMLAFPGGRERTAAEFEELFANCGFELTQIVPTASPLAVVEAVKK